jgi:hypothetical protein
MICLLQTVNCAILPLAGLETRVSGLRRPCWNVGESHLRVAAESGQS